MKYATVCSGTECFGKKWHTLGFRQQFVAEISKHPSAVLRYHYPDVLNYGDFTQVQASEATAVDLLAGGTPCQDFSLAGLRAGTAGDKGNLTLQFLLLIKRLGPRWVVWENVPGTFSSISHAAPAPVPPPPPVDLGRNGAVLETHDEYDATEQHAFDSFLAGLSELGYGVSYRVFDAQHAGVPQRRRRIFVVAYSGIVGRPAHEATISERGYFSSVSAAVLFESHSLRGHSAPGRETGQSVANTITAGVGNGGQQEAERGLLVYQCHGNNVNELGTLRTGQTVTNGVPFLPAEPLTFALRGRDEGGVPELHGDGSTVGALRSAGGGSSRDYVLQHEVTATLEATAGRSRGAGTPIGLLTVAEPLPFDTGQISSKTNRSNPQPGDACHTISAHGHPPAIAFGWNKSAAQTMRCDELTDAVQAAPSSQPAVFHQAAVRRLTPRECERLMGWEDDWTRYGRRPDGTVYEVADGPRYEMCGNGWAKPLADWLGERVMLVEGLLRRQASSELG